MSTSGSCNRLDAGGGDWFFHLDQYGRIHTNVSNPKRELRPHLLVEGQRLVNVDLANSQPLFIGLILSNGAGGQEVGRGDRETGERGERARGLYVGQSRGLQVATAAPDVGRYLELCEGGELYRHVHRQVGGKMDYETAKRRVIAALFGRDRHRNAVYRVLDEQFPTVLEFIRRVKRDDYRRLAHLAQRAESRFMFGQVVPRLMRECPGLFIATIHDSVLVPCEAGEYVRQVMLSEFRRLGVSPTVRIER